MKELQYGESGVLPWGYGCANSIVLSKIKEALGLDAAKYCCVGAAPIAVETLEYFGSLGINIYEGFGQASQSYAFAWKAIIISIIISITNSHCSRSFVHYC
jgi:long-subunit acyl-CoA synthetase (AMP-forming)